MSRYFFHVRNQTDYTRDTTGVELSNFNHVRRQAASSAGQILTSDLDDGHDKIAFEIQVEDGNDARLLTLHIQGIVDGSRRSAPDEDSAG